VRTTARDLCVMAETYYWDW